MSRRAWSGTRWLVEFGEFADAAVEGAGGLGCFGGVLGDVGGDGLFGDVVAVAEGRDGLDVELRAPATACGRAGLRRRAR